MELRIEYDIDTGNFTTSCLNAIRDFLSRTNDYTLETSIINYVGGTESFPSQVVGISRAYFSSSYSYFVAHSTLNDLYLIFMSFGGRVGLFVSTDWDDTEEIFYQKDVIYNDFYTNTTDISGSNSYRNFAYYIPMPTVGTCNKLVANYNPENETVMFSGLEPITYNFGTFTTSQNLSHSICFGNLTKYGHWDDEGGFWYGGDGVCSLELYFRSYVNSSSLTNPITFRSAKLFWQYESNCTRGLDFHKRSYWWWEGGYTYPWYDDPFSLVADLKVTRLPDTVNHFNRFECFLKINMDKFPIRPAIKKEDENDIDQDTDRRLPRVSDIPGGFRHTPEDYDEPILCLTITKSSDGKEVFGSRMIPIVMRKQVWATTTLSNYYAPMISSIDNVSKGLPTYWSLMSQSTTDGGHTVNDLNNISMVVRLYLMVQRDPQVLNDYSCVGYNDVINYVNMKNMSTNRYLNGTYPVKMGYYNCFQTGVRRSDLGFKGYAGLAFKMEEQDNEDNEDNETNENEDNENENNEELL